MKITVLSDNTRNINHSYTAEHGLSLWIECVNNKIIYDFGASDLLFANASLAGIDLTEANFGFISHGHCDHTGGLARFLDNNLKANIHLHPDAWNHHLSKTTGEMRFIGIDRTILKSHPERFIHIDKTTLNDNFGIIIPENSTANFTPSGNKNLFKETGSGIIRDDFTHETILVIPADNDIVVFSGCSHHGVENIISAVNNIYPDKHIRAFFGGFHTANPRTNILTETESTIHNLAIRLSDLDVGIFYTGHCTGEAAYAVMKPLMKDRLHLFYVGETILL